MTAAIGLKRCPFCGGDRIRQYSFKNGFDVYYAVQCYCQARAEGRTDDEAVESWNKRKPVDALIFENEALRKDADRYRWLRDPNNAAEVEHLVWTADSMDTFDAAIDSAMSKESAL